MSLTSLLQDLKKKKEDTYFSDYSDYSESHLSCHYFHPCKLGRPVSIDWDRTLFCDL